MKFTIGTVSNIQEYDQDINLIKSSLLYADDIELIGLTEYTVFKYLPSVFDGGKDLDELISGLITFLRSVNIENKDDLIKQIEYVHQQLQYISPILKKKKRRSSIELQAQYKVNQVRKELKEQLSELTTQLTQSPSSREIQSLIDKEIVSVFDYQLKSIDMEEMTGSYVANILNSMKAANSFPLFDATSSSFISSIADVKLLDIGKLDAEKIRHAGVATKILMRLPTLERASFDELLDLKRQNSAPLARFRKAIYGFSETVSTMPWDKDFEYECIKLYDTEVLPQVEEINELFKETGTLKNLSRKVFSDEQIRKKAGIAAGGLATAITTANALEDLVRNLLVAMSMAVFSGEAASAFLKIINFGIQAHDETREALKKGTGNSMYYYYIASKL